MIYRPNIFQCNNCTHASESAPSDLPATRICPDYFDLPFWLMDVELRDTVRNTLDTTLVLCTYYEARE